MVFKETNRKYTRRIKAVGIPLMSVEIYTSIYARQPLTSAVLIRFSIDVALLIIMWFAVEHFSIRFRRAFPLVKDIFWRAPLSVVCGALVGFILHFVVVEVLVNGVRKMHIDQFPFHMLFLSITIVVVYEVVSNFVELSHAEREREQLLESHLKSQLSSLKSQVNPHFLFNSLNTLLSLIPKSPKLAEQFVQDLARVYRYLLQANEKEITTLERELAFADHYFQLLKTRFGNSISLSVQIDSSYHNYYIPSLTLQLLIENAVKHNIISPSKPLRIEIFTSMDDYPLLNVRNNLQQKMSNVPSSQLGLANIIAKFNLLVDREIQVIKKDDFFLVSIPLLQEVHKHLRK